MGAFLAGGYGLLFAARAARPARGDGGGADLELPAAPASFVTPPRFRNASSGHYRGGPGLTSAALPGPSDPFLRALWVTHLRVLSAQQSTASPAAELAHDAGLLSTP